MINILCHLARLRFLSTYWTSHGSDKKRRPAMYQMTVTMYYTVYTSFPFRFLALSATLWAIIKIFTVQQEILNITKYWILPFGS